MASPKKVENITLSATTLTDDDLPIVQFDRVGLITFLNSVSSNKVVLFFSGEGSDNKLVIAGLNAQGKPSSSDQLPSTNLPCPPYCNR